VKHDLLLHVGEQKAKGSFERGTFEYRLGYRT
jgi:hypothetical protein